MKNKKIITTEIDIEPTTPRNEKIIANIKKTLDQNYNVTFEEYKDIRNNLVREFDYKLPYEELENALLHKTYMNFVAEGYLEIEGINSEGIIIFKMSDFVKNYFYEKIKQGIFSRNLDTLLEIILEVKRQQNEN